MDASPPTLRRGLQPSGREACGSGLLHATVLPKKPRHGGRSLELLDSSLEA